MEGLVTDPKILESALRDGNHSDVHANTLSDLHKAWLQIVPVANNLRIQP